MTYLLDKKEKRKSIFNISIYVLVFLILIYFRSSIFNSFSYLSSVIFKPVLVFGNNISDELAVFGSYLKSKKSLLLENENLKSQLLENNAQLSNYNSILDENTKIKEILGRKNEKMNLILSAILAKPNHSIYDTLLIDVGANKDIKTGDRVFALGDVPIGYVGEVYPSSLKVILFSNPGEKIEGIISQSFTALGKDVSVELTGRGGGNFEMILPQGFTLEKGTDVVLPGIKPYVLGQFKTIISDPRDSFIKALFVSPVNVQELKFVEVEK